MGGGGVAKERKEIESVTGNKIRDNLNFVFLFVFFFDKPKCLKTSNYPNAFNF